MPTQTELGLEARQSTQPTAEGAVSPTTSIDLFGFAQLEVSKGKGRVSGIKMEYQGQTVIIIGNEEDNLRLFDDKGDLKVASKIGDIRQKERLASEEIDKILEPLNVVSVSNGHNGQRLISLEGQLACLDRKPVSLIEIRRHEKKGKKISESAVVHYK